MGMVRPPPDPDLYGSLSIDNHLRRLLSNRKVKSTNLRYVVSLQLETILALHKGEDHGQYVHRPRHRR